MTTGLPKVSFTLGTGSLGRPLTGFDHYSTMIAYDYAGSATSAYSSIGNKTYTSLKDAETDGVVDTCAEATAATSAQTVSTAGTNGDVVTITVGKWDGSTITLGSYIKVTADSTGTLVATSIVAAINALTYIHGFSATLGVSGAYTITAPKTWGVYLNTKSVVNTMSSGATIAITNVAFTGGTKSQLAMFHYQISEFFRGNPLGILYFAIKWDDSGQSASAFNTQLQTDGLAVGNLFKGQARQFLFYNPQRAFATSALTSLGALRTTLRAQYTPGAMLLFMKPSGALSAQANTRALSAAGCAQIIGQSGTGTGLDLTYTQQTEIGFAGITLGIMSACSVSQSIGEVQAFNISDGAECEVAHFFDRTDFQTISTALADQLHDYGYIFPIKMRGGKTGTFINAGNCAVSPSDDYAYMEDNRTMDKAIRGVYLSIVDLLNSKNKVNADGTLAEISIARYNEKCKSPLDQMVRDGDLSDFSIQVDRSAVVSTTGIVPITIKLQQEGITRQIAITIGFAATV